MIEIFQKKNIKIKDIVFGVCVLVSFILLCINLYLCFFDNLWVDEVFSLYIIEGSYLDIIVNTAIDVHPPFFYIILKFFVDIISFIFSSVNIIILAKIISFSSIIILFYFLIFKMSEVVDKVIAGFLTLIIFALSPFEEFALTIRMYGFAVLFCFVCLYYVIKILNKNNAKDWRFFVLFFELSAYTHYFALITCVGLLLYLWIYFIIKDRKQFLNALYYTIFCIVFYVPWLTVLCCQFAYIKSYGYWISSITSGDINNLINYVFAPNYINNKILIYLICALYLILFSIVIFSKKIKNIEKWICFIGSFSMLFLIFVGLSVSYLITPIFIERYTIPAFLGFYFSVIYSIYLIFKNHLTELSIIKSNKIKKIITYLAIACFAVIISITALINVVHTIKSENIKYQNHIKNEQILEKYSTDIKIFDYGQTQSQLEYLYGMKTYSLNGCDVSWWENVSHIKHNIVDEMTIVELIKDNGYVLFFNNSYVISNLDNYNIKYEMIETIIMERSEVSIFKLTLNNI